MALGLGNSIAHQPVLGGAPSLPDGYEWLYTADTNVYSDLSSTDAIIGDSVAEWSHDGSGSGSPGSFLQGGATNLPVLEKALRFVAQENFPSGLNLNWTAVSGSSLSNSGGDMRVTNSGGGGAGGGEWGPIPLNAGTNYMIWGSCESTTAIATGRVKVGSTSGATDLAEEQ